MPSRQNYLKKLVCFTDTNYVIISESFHLKDWLESGCNLETTINSKFFGQKKACLTGQKHTAENLKWQEIRIFNLHSCSPVWSNVTSALGNLNNIILYSARC